MQPRHRHVEVPGPARVRRWQQLAPPVLGILALMAFLTFARPPSDAYGWRMVFEIGHIPLFGVTSLLMLRIVSIWRLDAQLNAADYLLALLATAVLSLAAEAVQLVQPTRHANIGDALRNLTGAVCFIGIAAGLRRRLWRRLGPDGRIAARLVVAGALLALGLAVLPLAGVAWSYLQRTAALPVVADLTAGWQKPFLNVGRSELARVPAPRHWVEQAGGRVARLTFLDAPWPGFTVREPHRDWSDFTTLRFQVWSDLEVPVEIVLRVDDTHRSRAHSDRFNGSFIVVPGLNDFSVPLATIAKGPRDRMLDLSDISQFILFSRRPEEPFELYFSTVWLEGERGRIADPSPGD